MTKPRWLPGPGWCDCCQYVCAVRDIFLWSAPGSWEVPWRWEDRCLCPLRPTCVGRGHSADCPPGDWPQLWFPRSGGSVLSDLEMCLHCWSLPSILCLSDISSLFPTFSVLPPPLLYFIPQKIAEKSRHALLPQLRVYI